MFQRNVLSPPSGLKSKTRAALYLLVDWLAHSLTLKMRVAHSSKTVVNFYWTTQHLIPEDFVLCVVNVVPVLQNLRRKLLNIFCHRGMFFILCTVKNKAYGAIDYLK
jgi:hypothetical protein